MFENADGAGHPETVKVPRRYRARRQYQIVAHTRRWAALSAVLLVLSLSGLAVRGLHLGLEFRGGAQFTVAAASCDVAGARQAASTALAGSGAGTSEATVVALSSGAVQVTTGPLNASEAAKVTAALASECAVPAGDVKVQLVGPTWGGEITKKALAALAVFLAAVSVFLAIYFEWRMAAAALVALVHDVVITVGVYAWTGLEVTPATVIGFLTILGFSLYDTVVVFDKVKESTRGIFKQSSVTYSQAANTALNATMVRSINTSVVAMLPVAAILVVGAGLLGAGTLKDLATALLVGTATGAYSSLFVATPLLCWLTERSAAAKELTLRVSRRSRSRGQGGGPAPVPGRPGAGSAKPSRKSRK